CNSTTTTTTRWHRGQLLPTGSNKLSNVLTFHFFQKKLNALSINISTNYKNTIHNTSLHNKDLKGISYTITQNNVLLIRNSYYYTSQNFHKHSPSTSAPTT
ncbi:hypothetical protein CARUB_v100079900mg, partial [Capsella rubella]